MYTTLLSYILGMNAFEQRIGFNPLLYCKVFARIVQLEIFRDNVGFVTVLMYDLIEVEWKLGCFSNLKQELLYNKVDNWTILKSETINGTTRISGVHFSFN